MRYYRAQGSNVVVILLQKCCWGGGGGGNEQFIEHLSETKVYLFVFIYLFICLSITNDTSGFYNSFYMI